MKAMIWGFFALVACGLLGLVACGSAPPPAQPTDCPEGLNPFKDGCADRLTINFMTCTEGRGRSLERNEQLRLEGAVNTAFKVTGVGGVVDVAREVVETENTPVAQDIVRNCLELTNRIPDIPPSQSREITGFIDELEDRLRDAAEDPSGEPPTIQLNPSRGSVTSPVTVTGEHWPSNIEIEVLVHTDRTRVTTDSTGQFSTTISINKMLANLGNNVQVIVHPVDPLIMGRSPLMTQSALYTFEP